MCGKDDNSSELGKRNEVIVELPVARETTPGAWNIAIGTVSRATEPPLQPLPCYAPLGGRFCMWLFSVYETVQHLIIYCVGYARLGSNISVSVFVCECLIQSSWICWSLVHLRRLSHVTQSLSVCVFKCRLVFVLLPYFRVCASAWIYHMNLRKTERKCKFWGVIKLVRPWVFSSMVTSSSPLKTTYSKQSLALIVVYVLVGCCVFHWNLWQSYNPSITRVFSTFNK